MHSELDALEAAHRAYETFGQSGDLKAARLSDACMSAILKAGRDASTRSTGGSEAMGVKALKHARERFAQIECAGFSQNITSAADLADYRKAIAHNGFNETSRALADLALAKKTPEGIAARDAVIEEAQAVYDKLASESGTVTIIDQERLGDALRALRSTPPATTSEGVKNG